MNKGFTLVELIAVITILGLIAVITTPAYESISKNIKTTNYNSKKSSIKAQTLSYVEKFMKNEVFDGNSSPKVDKALCFTVDYLIHNGIISSDSEKEEYIENDITKERYSGNNSYIKVLYDKQKLKLVAFTIDEKEIVLNGQSYTINKNESDCK